MGREERLSYFGFHSVFIMTFEVLAESFGLFGPSVREFIDPCFKLPSLLCFKNYPWSVLERIFQIISIIHYTIKHKTIF